MIIGEAAKRVPMSSRQEYPQFLWRNMAGMRDRTNHSYDTVDLEHVWDVVRRDVPQIRPPMKQILADYEVQG